MSASHLASFAPYTPPPDDPLRSSNHITMQASAGNSYQSGGLSAAHPSNASGGSLSQSQWETRYGWRVDLLAAAAYILGPISALLILITETHNDYVRFHAYQSALVTTPLLFLRIILSLAHFPLWIRSIYTVGLILLQIAMAIRAFFDAAHGNLSYFYAPFVGHTAEIWLAEE